MLLDTNAINTHNYHFEEIFSCIPAIIFVYDLSKSDFIWNNGKYKDILGYDPQYFDTVNVDIEKHLILPDDRYIVDERIAYFKNLNNADWSGVFRVKHFNGNWLWLYLKLLVFERKPNKQPLKLLGFALSAMENFKTMKSLHGLVNEQIKEKNQSKITVLTRRELEIICLITQGHSYTHIASKLNIQPDTVNKHRKNILSKLCLKNIASLTYFAKENGIA